MNTKLLVLIYCVMALACNTDKKDPSEQSSFIDKRTVDKNEKVMVYDTLYLIDDQETDNSPKTILFQMDLAPLEADFTIETAINIDSQHQTTTFFMSNKAANDQNTELKISITANSSISISKDTCACDKDRVLMQQNIHMMQANNTITIEKKSDSLHFYFNNQSLLAIYNPFDEQNNITIGYKYDETTISDYLKFECAGDTANTLSRYVSFVSNVNDTGQGSWNQAINNIHDNYIIAFIKELDILLTQPITWSNKNISVESYCSKVIFDGKNLSARAFSINNNSKVRFKNITFQNCPHGAFLIGTNVQYNTLGSADYSYLDTSKIKDVALFESCTFKNHSSYRGAALYGIGKVRFEKCRFESNKVSDDGGAVYIDVYSLFNDCVFINNIALDQHPFNTCQCNFEDIENQIAARLSERERANDSVEKLGQQGDYEQDESFYSLYGNGGGGGIYSYMGATIKGCIFWNSSIAGCPDVMQNNIFYTPRRDIYHIVNQKIVVNVTDDSVFTLHKLDSLLQAYREVKTTN